MFSPQTLQKLGCTSARGSSATRFGEISPFWQNMAFLWRFIVILAEFKPTLAIFYDMWQIFIFANGLIWKNHLTIWSHWSLHFLQKHFYAINFPPKCVDGDAKKYFRLINLLHTRDVASVWPDVGMKSSQIVSKSCQKIANANFYINKICFKIAQIFINCLDNFCNIIFLK